MPIYEYRREDGTTFEILQSFSDEALTQDPETGMAVQRVLHAPAVHFKGKGFYNTDYGTRNRQRETAANAEASPPDGSSKSENSSNGGASKDGSSAGPSKPESSSSSSDGGSSSTASPKSNGASKVTPAKK